MWDDCVLGKWHLTTGIVLPIHWGQLRPMDQTKKFNYLYKEE
jgi:hypothetical protein